MKTSKKFKDVISAFIKAQASMKAAVKDSVNPHFKSRYADLAAVWDAVQQPLADNDLAVIQDVSTDENGVQVTTRIFHSSEQWIECGPITIPVDKRNAHGVASACTYGRRYGLSATFGVITEDDDGNAAVESAPKTISEKQQQELQEALDAIETSAQSLSQAMKVTSLKSIPVSRFKEAQQKIADRKARLEAQDEAA